MDGLDFTHNHLSRVTSHLGLVVVVTKTDGHTWNSLSLSLPPSFSIFLIVRWGHCGIS